MKENNTIDNSHFLCFTVAEKSIDTCISLFSNDTSFYRGSIHFIFVVSDVYSRTKVPLDNELN